MALHDKAVAIHARQFELLSGQVRQGVRQDDKIYYENLATQTALVAADEGMPGLWKAIKRLLPKSRSKAKLSVRCCGPDPVDIKNHFNALEAGGQIDYRNLVERCFAHQKALCDEAPLLVPLEHIPTRIDMEQLVLRQKSNRAPGLDGVTSETLKQSSKTDSLPFFQLFLKSWLLGAEPIQFKGGMIHCIAKKQGIVNDAAKMRGIMLLDSLGKIFHGLVRKFLMGWALPRRLPCQFGGYEAQQTLYATQLLRTVSRFHTRHGLSSGVLFVDVKAAFHSLLREIAFGAQTTFPEVLSQRLLAEGFDVNHLQECIPLESLDFLDTAPPALVRLAHDTHQHYMVHPFAARLCLLDASWLEAWISPCRPCIQCNDAQCLAATDHAFGGKAALSAHSAVDWSFLPSAGLGR